MFGVHYNSVVNAFLKEEEVKDKAILDIGSLVINSRSARFIVAPYEPKEYIGIDTISGVGVDKVCCIEDLLVEYGEEKFDIILMTAMLEVTKDYQSAISAAKRLCKKNGIMILTARTGRHPKDLQRNEYWRYEEDDIQTLFADCNIVMKANDSNFTEIFFKIIKPQDVIEINYEHIELYSSILNRRILGKGKVLESMLSLIEENTAYAEKENAGYFSRYTELEQLGLKRATDKSALVHNYLNKYDMFLKHLCQEEFVFLELGVFHGSSVKMWNDYFRKAKIIGVDIDPKCKEYANERINILTADLSSIRNLQILTSLKPKVIIDDASHICSHQISALFELFSCLPSGGVYIMEDIGTSLDQDLYAEYNDISVSAYDVLSQIAEVCAGGQKLKIPREFQVPIEEIGKQVEMISFIRESCIIIKK